MGKAHIYLSDAHEHGTGSKRPGGWSGSSPRHKSCTCAPSASFSHHASQSPRSIATASPSGASTVETSCDAVEGAARVLGGLEGCVRLGFEVDAEASCSRVDAEATCSLETSCSFEATCSLDASLPAAPAPGCVWRSVRAALQPSWCTACQPNASGPSCPKIACVFHAALLSLLPTSWTYLKQQMAQACPITCR